MSRKRKSAKKNSKANCSKESSVNRKTRGNKKKADFLTESEEYESDEEETEDTPGSSDLSSEEDDLNVCFL